MRIKKAQAVMFNIIFIAALATSGCGYSIHRQSALPATEISIGLIDNRTVEPKLQDKLQRALTEEFMKQGIRVSRGAEYRITGVVNSFDLMSLSEKGGVTAEYRVTVSAEFRLFDREGRVVKVKNISSPFIVALTDPGDLGRLLALKDIAEERAMSDIAMEIVGALLFR
ncbi:MAG: LPS assembly lipoprotein LptE [Thermodesulfovibrionales bacterium]